MAGRSRTLQNLLDGVSDRADVDIAVSGVRHTQAKVTDRINRAAERWLAMIAESGDDTNLKTTRTATAISSVRDANNWAPNQYVSMPSGAMLIRGIDIFTNNTPLAMLPVDELERNDTQLANSWWLNGGIGLPVLYRVGGTNGSGSNIIQIFPWADAVYTVDIRYIPNLVDLVNVSDTMDFISSGDMWVINEAAMETLLSDGLAGMPEYQTIQGKNREIEAELRFTLAKRGRIRKVDTIERRRTLLSLSQGPWRFL